MHVYMYTHKSVCIYILLALTECLNGDEAKLLIKIHVRISN